MKDTKQKLETYENHIDFELTKSVSSKKISNWLPFIGKNYNNPKISPEKVLIVGLSHYDKMDNENWKKTLDSTIPNIVSVVENGLGIHNGIINNNKLFRGLECVFFNIKKLEVLFTEIKEKREKLWNSIAFHQLIEVPVIGGSKHTDTKKTRIEGFLKLVNLIKLIKPNHIIMMSNQWKYHDNFAELLRLKDIKIDYINIVPSKSDIKTVFFNNEEYNFTFNAIHHPSYFKYIKKQHELLKKVMPKFINYLND